MSECPSCRSNRVKVIYQGGRQRDRSDGYAICRCVRCHLVFASPTPSQQELISFYTSGYFTQSSKVTGYTDYWANGEQHMRKMWPVLKEYANLDAVLNRDLLDVGCASGGLLFEANKDGWRTVGVEFGEDAVTRAKDVLGLDVRQGDIFSDTLNRSQFSVATMWHVLEHVPEPLAALRRAHETLAPGGLLFAEVPNWNSLGRLVKGRDWSQIVPPAHLNYFTRTSIHRIAEEAGFDVIKTSTHHIAGFDRIAASPRPRFVKQVFRRVETAVGHLGYGGYLRILARKPSAAL